MITRTITKEETEMRELVVPFKEALQKKDFHGVSKALQSIRTNLEPLGYWLPYKDLTDLLTSRCSEDTIPLFSENEVTYLWELSDKLGDKDSDVGLGTIQEFSLKIKNLQAEREMGRIDTLEQSVMDAKIVRSILNPQNFEEQIAEYCSRGSSRDKRKGLWDAWSTISRISGNEKGLKNIVGSGITGESVEQYVDTFMDRNLFSNVFQIDAGGGMIPHLTDMFKLYFRLKEDEGSSKEDMPSYLEDKIAAALNSTGSYMGWTGTREFAIMNVSTNLADEDFLGAEWSSYQPDKQCFEWMVEFAKTREHQKARYVSRIARDCGRGFRGLVSRAVHSNVLDFTRKFVRQDQIDEEKGELLWVAQTFSGEDYKSVLSQPFTYRAIVAASDRGHKFAIDLVEQMDDRLTEEGAFMMGAFIDIAARMNETPYVDHIANEPREHLEHRVSQLIERNNTEYFTQAPKTFQRELQEGSYIFPMNECNTSLEDMKMLARKGKTEVRNMRQKVDSDDYMYVARNVFFHFQGDAKKPRIYVGNPQEFKTFAPILGYSPISISQYDPETQNPERNVVIEFEDATLRGRASRKIVNDWYGGARGEDNSFPFNLSKLNNFKHENVLWDLR